MVWCGVVRGGRCRNVAGVHPLPSVSVGPCEHAQPDVRCRPSPSGMSEMDGVCVSKLIDLVRDRPVLWDRQEEVYKNRKLTKKAWTEICEALLENYAELPDEDQKSFGKYCYKGHAQ